MPKFREFGLKEVVVPAVHVKHNGFALQETPAARAIAHKCGEAFALVVIRQWQLRCEESLDQYIRLTIQRRRWLCRDFTHVSSDGVRGCACFVATTSTATTN